MDAYGQAISWINHRYWIRKRIPASGMPGYPCIKTTQEGSKWQSTGKRPEKNVKTGLPISHRTMSQYQVLLHVPYSTGKGSHPIPQHAGCC